MFTDLYNNSNLYSWNDPKHGDLQRAVSTDRICIDWAIKAFPVQGQRVEDSRQIIWLLIRVIVYIGIQVGRQLRMRIYVYI